MLVLEVVYKDEKNVWLVRLFEADMDFPNCILLTENYKEHNNIFKKYFGKSKFFYAII